VQKDFQSREAKRCLMDWSQCFTTPVKCIVAMRIHMGHGRFNGIHLKVVDSTSDPELSVVTIELGKV
jgi:hypothetical protein